MKGVLVVDGAAFFRAYAARLVRGWGWPVAGLCATAAEAREAFQRERPGVVLLDLFLPDGDGRRLLAELKGLDPGVAVIVCTAAGDRASVAAALQLGARDYLVKPVDEERLRSALAACLGQPAGPEARGGAAVAFPPGRAAAGGVSDGAAAPMGDGSAAGAERAGGGGGR